MTAVRVGDRSCLVTGGNGFVGSCLVAHLLKQGWSVRCLVRKTSNRDLLDAAVREAGGAGQIEFAIGDVTDPSSLVAAVRGVGTIFHVAGLIRAPRVSDYFRVNALGTSNLLDACHRSSDRIDRVLLVSSQAAVGPSLPGNPLDESAPCRPITPYGESKRRGEEAALAYRERLPITIVRPPTVYGPGDRETLMLFKTIRFGVRPRLRRLGAISVVHVRDLVDGIVRAATHPSAVGQTYFVSDPTVYTYDDLIGTIARVTGGGRIPIPVPDRAIRLAARLSEAGRLVTGPSSVFDRWKAEEILRGSWACSSERARRDIGFSASYTLDDGIRDAVAWYRESGWL